MSTTTKPAERRVVITGVGLVSPLGSQPTEFAAALSEGRSAIQQRDASEGAPSVGTFAESFSGKIDDFGELAKDQKKAIRKGLKLMCRETQMAVAAAQHALADSGGLEDSDPERFGVVLGSDYMLTLPVDYTDGIAKCVTDGEFDYTKWGSEGLDEMTPLWMLKYLPNMPASHIAIYNDLRGPNNSLTMREASGLMALGEAYRMIARGSADRMVAGATGTRVLPMQAIHALQHHQTVTDLPAGTEPADLCQPFHPESHGMVCGEGAGMLVIESLESAEARGAKIYGEVTGFGASVVAKTPAGSGSLEGDNLAAIAGAMRAALGDADVAASDLGHINADGVGTVEVDQVEAEAIANVLGDADVPVVALKRYFGALGAGSGVVELIGSVLALQEGTLPAATQQETSPAKIRLAKSGDPAGDSFLTISTTPQGQAAAVCIARPS